MPNTTAIVTFNSLPVADNYIRLFAHLKTPPFDEHTKGETFKAVRTTAGEVTIPATINEAAANYASAFATDYPEDFIVTVLDNVVTVVCTLDGVFDYFNSVTIYGGFATYELVSPSISITGLDNDLYLINNEININLSSSQGAQSFTILFENETNQVSTKPIVIYPSPSGIARLEISGYIKSIFKLPSDAAGYVINNQPTSNANQVKITVTSGEVSQELTKVFIRGGNRTNNTNQFLASGQICRPTIKLPIWQGFPTADYIMHSSGRVTKRLLQSVPDENKDYRRKKGCNEVYLKFINQQGGYCHWLFETHQSTETAKNLGSFIQDNDLQDLGNSSDSKMKLTGKIPAYYKGYINDLIASPEVYAYINGEFVRCLASANSFPSDNAKRSYSVSINLDFDYRFNPSVLWD